MRIGFQIRGSIKNKTKAKPKKTCNFDQLPISRLSLRRKKKPLWFRFPTDPIFLPTLLFFQRDCPCDPIFSGWLRAAAKMASVVTLIIEKTMKKIFKKK